MKAVDYVPYSGPIVTLENARSLGLLRYFTGKSCKNGHIDERATINSACITCKRLRMRVISTPEKSKIYYDANAETIRQKRRDYTAKHRTAKGFECQRIEALRKAAIEAGESRYYTGVPCKHGHICGRLINSKHCEICHLIKARSISAEKKLEYQNTRRARKKGVGGRVTAAEIRDLLKKQKYRCANPACKCSIKKKFHRDHIIAIVNGGPNVIGNIQLLCPPCNHKKHKKDPLVWMREQGFLL